MAAAAATRPKWSGPGADAEKGFAGQDAFAVGLKVRLHAALELSGVVLEFGGAHHAPELALRGRGGTHRRDGILDRLEVARRRDRANVDIHEAGRSERLVKQAR